MPYYTKRHILFYVEKSELTELFRARDASCPKGKKMEQRKSLTTRNLMRKIIYIIYRLWSENDHLSRIGGNQFSTFLYCNHNKEEVSKCKLKSS